MNITNEDFGKIKEIVVEIVNESEKRLRSEIKQSEERLRVEITDKLTKEIAKSELRIMDHTSKEIEMNHALAADLLFENFPSREEVRIMIEDSNEIT